VRTSLTIVALAGVCVLFVLGNRSVEIVRPGRVAATPEQSPKSTVSLIAVGDVNLGRAVGQEILAGDTLFPFVHVQETFARYDIVFANLECTLSEQGGETQHPRNNLIFTGPPAGARSLRAAGVTIVSTANNHALDYGVRAHAETMTNLREAGIVFAGTSSDSGALFDPVLMNVGGILIAFFACTDVMNIEDEMWKRYVAAADTGQLLPRIREIKESVDFIVVSYHGGDEYAHRPTARTKSFARSTLDAGADLFLGHHPHVPQGIEVLNGKFIVYSLGNFVFRQPFQYWTQRSFALSMDLRKDGSNTYAESVRVLPVESGLQPRFLNEGEDFELIRERIRQLSSIEATKSIAW
jgi:poly-gamma-glutamate capsule biosynthesis protein CapA/YwtB (metallophosphatase superfamily)